MRIYIEFRVHDTRDDTNATRETQRVHMQSRKS